MKEFLFAITSLLVKITILSSWQTAGSLILAFFLILNPSVVITVFVLKLSLLTPITIKNGELITSHLRDIKPLKYTAKVLKDVFYTRNHFKTNIVVSNSSNTDEPWYLVTNDVTSRAIRNYSYRFGSIETVFKSQKSNRL